MTTEVGIDWSRALARRAASIGPSVFVEFDDLPAHPDPISFAGGTPPRECLPIERMSQAIRRAWDKVDPETLYYGDSRGYQGLRELIAVRMARRGVDVDPDQIVVTNGSQQGLDLAAKAIIEPGDEVIIEAPTYFGALQVFDVYEARYIPVAVDEHGLIPEELERALESASRPRLIYTIPTFQNPSGVTLSAERQCRLSALSRRFNVPIVEDDPYGELWFRGGPPRPLRAIDPDVIYLGTFSKTLAPALRMGWMVAPHSLTEIFADAKEGVDIQSDRLVQRAVVEASRDGWLDDHLDEARAIYRDRCDHMLECLAREMPAGVHWTEPDGGFFIWVTLPGDVDSYALLRECAAAGAVYIPGTAFYPNREPRSTFRLGFSTLPKERITLGIERLGRVLRAHLA